MTSDQKSSKYEANAVSNVGVDPLARDAYLHAIKVQDFSCYALIIGVRPRAAYEDDHITRAVSLTPTRLSSRPLAAGAVNAVAPLRLMAKEVLRQSLRR